MKFNAMSVKKPQWYPAAGLLYPPSELLAKIEQMQGFILNYSFKIQYYPSFSAIVFKVHIERVSFTFTIYKMMLNKKLNHPGSDLPQTNI